MHQREDLKSHIWRNWEVNVERHTSLICPWFSGHYATVCPEIVMT